MLFRAALPALALTLMACARPSVPVRGADGQVHKVQSATPAEYTEAVERGRGVPLPAKEARAVPAPAPAANATAGELLWIADDAPAALALAKAKNLPVFVDVWATWCHSCVHMREFVLKDAVVRALADKAMWLSVDADKPSNAAFLASAKVSAYPTFMVLAADGAERSRWAGTMDADQVARFLAGGKVVDDALAAVFKKAEAGDFRGCALEGGLWLANHRAVASSWDRLNVASATLSCSLQNMDSVKNIQRHRTALMDILIEDTTQSSVEYFGSHVDGTSSAYEVLIASFGDADAAVRVAYADSWSSYLHTASLECGDSSARRASLDAHRVLAYLAAGAPEKAIPMLEQTRLDFPRDFNPPARLAKVYIAMKDYPKARAEAAAALALVDGPRTVRVVSLAADIEKAAGDKPAERKQLESGVARCKKLWLPPSAEKALAELQKRLSKLPAR